MYIHIYTRVHTCLYVCTYIRTYVDVRFSTDSSILYPDILLQLSTNINILCIFTINFKCVVNIVGMFQENRHCCLHASVRFLTSSDAESEWKQCQEQEQYSLQWSRIVLDALYNQSYQTW